MATCSVLLAVFVVLSLQAVVLCWPFRLLDDVETTENMRGIEKEDMIGLTELEQRHDHQTETHVRVKRRNWWRLFKGGIDVFNIFTTAGVLVDGVVSHFYGCCVEYYPKHIKKLCDIRKKYYERLPIVMKLGTRLDDKYLEMEGLMEYIKQCNDNNREIWLSVKLLKSYTSTIVNTLDPDLIIKLRRKLALYRRLLERKNNTIVQLVGQKFDDDFRSMFADAETTAWSMSGYLGEVAFWFTKFAISQHKQSKMRSALNQKFGQTLQQNGRLHKVLGITDGNIKAHMKNTARGVYNRKTRVRSRMKKYRDRAFQGLGLLVSGVQILGIAFNLMKCEQVVRRSERALTKIKKAEVDMSKTYKNLTDFHKEMQKKGWNFVKDQVTDGNFTQLLKDIANVTENAGKQTKERKNARRTIMDFIKKIPAASFKETFKLQRKLIKALQVASFPFKCLTSKLRLVRNMISDCEMGGGSMEALFLRGKQNFPTFNSSDCRDKAGISYTFFSAVANLVRETMRVRGFQPDCIRNNKGLKGQACFLRDYEGLNITDIRSRLNITKGQAKYFLKKCPDRVLTRKERSQVCTLRNKGFSNRAIAIILKLRKGLLSLVQNVTGCSTPPPLTAAEEKQICDWRSLGLSNKQIAKTMERPFSQVRGVVCPTIPPLTEDQKKTVCLMRSLYSNRKIAIILGKPFPLVRGVKCKKSGK